MGGACSSGEKQRVRPDARMSTQSSRPAGTAVRKRTDAFQRPLGLPETFDKTIMAEKLKNGLDNKEEVWCVRTLLEYEANKRAEMSEEFEALYPDTLVGYAAGKVSQVALLVLHFLSSPRLSALAHAMYCKQGSPAAALQLVTQVLGLCSEAEVAELLECYKKKYGSGVEELIRGGTSEDLVALYTDMLKSTTPADPSCREGELTTLVGAMEDGTVGRAEGPLFSLLRRRARQDSREVLEMFLQKTGRDITTEIKKQVREEEEAQLLCLLVDAVRTGPYFFVRRIQSIIKEDTPEVHWELVFIIMAHNEGDLSELNKCYQKLFFERLQISLKEEMKDELVLQVLLKMLY